LADVPWVEGFFGAGTGTGTLCAPAIGVAPTIKAATSAATPAFRISISAAPRIPRRRKCDPSPKLERFSIQPPIEKRPAHG
jgi:hypothetical protein